ncbi:MAG: hypothetical protein KAH23_05760, partial [Kiritimatiellae bacterium]|nr:hypothetical protein [Kiritimatiellia bacterium]
MDISSIIEKMTLEQKIGQILTFEFVGIRFREDTYNKIENLQCGGLRITPHIHEAIPYHKRFDKDAPNLQRLAYHADPDFYAELIYKLQALAKKRPLGIPLHISIDMEGDLSHDYCRGGVNLMPSAMGVAATGDAALAEAAYKAMAEQLRAIGVTMVHSPVLDVNINPDNPEICSRAFGDTSEVVTEFATACMKGYMASNIVATAKHFPGRGDSAVDLHHDFDEDNRSLETIEALDLAPYRALIEQGLPAIMTAHQVCPAFGDSLPASVSPAIYSYIREVLKFDGVITTDAMGMKGVTARYEGLAQACAEAAAAGADMILAKCNPELENDVVDWITKYVDNGRITEADLDAKVARILKMKESQGLFGEYFSTGQAEAVIKREDIQTTIKTVAKKAIKLVRDEENYLPISKEARVLVVEPFFKEWQSKGFDNFYHPSMLSLFMEQYSSNVKLLEVNIDLTEEDEQDIALKAESADIIVVNLLFWRSSSLSMPEATKKLIEKGHKVIIVANTPYENICLPEAKALIVNWA